MKKKLFFLIAMLVVWQSASAYDFSAVAPSGQTLYYDTIDGNAQVTYEDLTLHNYSNLNGDLTIPSSVTYNDIAYYVTSIGRYAFADCTGLTSVTIPNTVTSIGKSAFSNCTGLTSIAIPNFVTTIDEYAFHGCTALTSITIPNSISTIDNSTFDGCTGLNSITLPTSVTSIGRSAFRDCTSLTSITIPNTVTTIDEYVFYGCTGLNAVTIPNSVTSIGNAAFYNCRSICVLSIPNVVTSIGYDAFYGIKNIVYNGSATGSPWGAICASNNFVQEDVFLFKNAEKSHLIGCCGSVEGAVSIPSTVDTIGQYAFYGCTGLTSVTIPNSVSFIGEFAFSGCSGLTSLTIPNSITTIGRETFSDCSGLTTVVIPNSVTSIGGDAFYGCTGICVLSVPNSVTSIGSSAFYGIKNIVYSGSATGSPWGANCASNNYVQEDIFIFKNAKKKYLIGCCGPVDGAITIPSTVETIGYKAFFNCTGMTSVSIPNSVTTIDDYAFYGCSSLNSVTIPNSVTSIGKYAFKGCTGLSGSLIIPNSVTSIGNSAFSGCTGINTVSIPNTVTSIVMWTFSDCTGLASVTIPTSVTSIGKSAFSGCTGLTSVTIPNTVTTIGNQAFSGCTGICALSVPNSVLEIGNYAFSEIKAVAYSGSATGSPWGAYNVTNAIYWDGDFIYQDVSKTQLVGCCSCPDGDFTIPSTVVSIGNYAFYNCTSLASINIPSSVTTIGNHAFSYCSELTSVFSNNPIAPSLGNNAFYRYGNTPNIYIPCGSLISYQNEWGSSFNYIEGGYSSSVSSNNNIMGNADYLPETSCLTLVVEAIPNDGYLFDHWSDGSTDNPYQLTLTQDTSLVAYFVVGRNLSVVSEEENMGSVSGSGIYPDGSTTQISAMPNYGYHFNHWNDGNTDNPRTITVSSDITYTAYFSPNYYTLSVISDNVSYGSVSGSGSYAYLSERTISVTANYGYHFDHWNDGNTGNPRTVTVTGDATYTAYFDPNQYTITVNSDNNTQGSASGGGSFNYLTERTINATANYGYHFTHWNDGNTDNPRTLTLTQDTSFTAFFDVNQYTLTLYSNDESQGSVSGGGTFNYLDTITISATAAAHYHFVRWSDYNTDNPRRYVITGNKTLYATFAIDEHTVSVAVDDISHGSVQASGTTFNYGSPCTVTATAYSGYTFSGWSNGMTDNPYTFAVLNNVDLIAYFVPTGSQPTTYYTITAVAADPSMGSVTGGGSYASGTTATLTASANSGYHFTHWQDNVTNNPRNVTVTGNATYTAYFESDGGGEQPSDNAPSIACVGVDMNGHNVVRWEPRQGVSVVRYNIYREGLGGYSQVGFVNATNATEYSWVDDNSNTATQAYSYKLSEVAANGTESDLSTPHTTMHLQISQGQGTTWNLSWTPYVGFNYSGYRIYRGTSSASMSLLTELSSSATTYSDNNAPSGNVYYQIEVVASSAKSITASSRSNIATSVQNQQFTITVLSDNTSMGTVSGGGTFAEGTTTTISATPLSGYTFSQWSDGSTQAQRTITVTGNATYTAYFTAGGSETQQYLITVVSNNPDRGTVSGGGLYDAGAVITITAEPFAGFEFVQWQDGNTNDFRAITVTADATYTAYFRTATESIDDVETADNLKIYTRGNRIVVETVGASTQSQNDAITVYDVMGRVVKQAAGNGQQAAVEIPVTAAGVYMVKVGERPSRKVIVKP